MEPEQAFKFVRQAVEKRHKAAELKFGRARAKRERLATLNKDAASQAAMLYRKAACIELDAAREEMNGLRHLLHCLAEFERQNISPPVRILAEPAAKQKSAGRSLRLVG
jgi:hypothetical protein